jgi:hypothetical protein
MLTKEILDIAEKYNIKKDTVYFFEDTLTLIQLPINTPKDSEKLMYTQLDYIYSLHRDLADARVPNHKWHDIQKVFHKYIENASKP